MELPFQSTVKAVFPILQLSVYYDMQFSAIKRQLADFWYDPRCKTNTLTVAFMCLAVMFKEQEIKDPSVIYHQLHDMLTEGYILHSCTSSDQFLKWIKLTMKKRF